MESEPAPGSRPDAQPSPGDLRQIAQRAEAACAERQLPSAVRRVLDLAAWLYALQARAESGVLLLDAMIGPAPTLQCARLLSSPYLRGYYCLLLSELAGRRGETPAVREAVDEYLVTPPIRIHAREYHTFGALEGALGWIAPHLDPPRLEALGQRLPYWLTLRRQSDRTAIEARPVDRPAGRPEAELIEMLARLRGEPGRPFDPTRPGRWEWDHIQLGEELLARGWHRSEDWFFLLDRMTMPYLRGRLLLRLSNLLPAEFFEEYRRRNPAAGLPARACAQAAWRLLLALEPGQAARLASRLGPLAARIEPGGPVSDEMLADGADLVLSLMEASPVQARELQAQLLDLIQPRLPPPRALGLVNRMLGRFAGQPVLDDRHVPLLERLAGKVREIRRFGRLQAGESDDREAGPAAPAGTDGDPIATLTRCSLLLFRATGQDDWADPGRLGIDRLGPMLDYLELADPPSGYLHGLATALGLPPSARDILGLLLLGPVWTDAPLAEAPAVRDLLRLAHLLPDDGRIELRPELLAHLEAILQRYRNDGWGEDFAAWFEAVPELFWLGVEALPGGPAPRLEPLRRALPWALVNEPESAASRIDIYRRLALEESGGGGEVLPLARTALLCQELACDRPPADPVVWAAALVEVAQTFPGRRGQWLAEHLLSLAARRGVLASTATGFLRKAHPAGDLQWLTSTLLAMVPADEMEALLAAMLEVPGWETPVFSPIVAQLALRPSVSPERACRLLAAMVQHALASPHAARNLMAAAVDAVRLHGGPDARPAFEEICRTIGLPLDDD